MRRILARFQRQVAADLRVDDRALAPRSGERGADPASGQ